MLVCTKYQVDKYCLLTSGAGLWLGLVSWVYEFHLSSLFSLESSCPSFPNPYPRTLGTNSSNSHFSASPCPPLWQLAAQSSFSTFKISTSSANKFSISPSSFFISGHWYGTFLTTNWKMLLLLDLWGHHWPAYRQVLPRLLTNPASCLQDVSLDTIAASMLIPPKSFLMSKVKWLKT